MNLERLIGKNILEVITELPNFEWIIKSESIIPKKTTIKELLLVYYDIEKPKHYPDLYHQFDVTNGITLEDLECTQDRNYELAGLTSKVMLGKPFEKYSYAHIPMIDFDMHHDFDFLEEQEKLEIIKKNAKETTEISQGLILRSGPKRNYHFLGIGELLEEKDFITFVGLALGMYIKPGDKKLNLADSRHLGHGLSTMKYIAELHNRKETGEKWSKYFCHDRFLTLRISPKPGYKDFPRVIDVLK